MINLYLIFKNIQIKIKKIILMNMVLKQQNNLNQKLLKVQKVIKEIIPLYKHIKKIIFKNQLL